MHHRILPNHKKKIKSCSSIQLGWKHDKWSNSEGNGQIQDDLCHVWTIKKHRKRITNRQWQQTLRINLLNFPRDAGMVSWDIGEETLTSYCNVLGSHTLYPMWLWVDAKDFMPEMSFFSSIVSMLPKWKLGKQNNMKRNTSYL